MFLNVFCKVRQVVLSAVVATLLVNVLSAEAQAQNRASRAPRAAITNAEDAFSSARDAASSFDADKLAQMSLLAKQAGTDSPVQRVLPYLDYWRLKVQLRKFLPAPAASDGARPESTDEAKPDVRGENLSSLDGEIRLFLGKHAGTIYADLMRRDWLYSLAKRGEWAAFDAQYPLWQLKDEPLLICWAGVSKLNQTKNPEAKQFDEFQEAIYGVRDIGDSCEQLLAGMQRAGLLSRAQIWKRLQVSLDAGGFNAVKRVEDFFVPTASEQLVIANARLARQNPKAVATVAATSTALSQQDKAFVWSLAAANGMKKLLPESHEWTQEAFKYKPSALPDETLAWMTRAALRQQDWSLVKASIELMSAETKREPVWTYWLARALRSEGKEPAKAQVNALFGSIAMQPNFYGQLAAEELGQLVTIPVKAAATSEAEATEASRNEGLARSLAFYDLGLRNEGNREWNFQLRNRSDRQLLAIADFACKKSVLDRCVNSSDRTKTEFDFTQRFVTPFRDALEPIAAERSVDLAWIYGLIRQESRFIMDARSSVGASGLMQIMPATGRWIAKRLNVADFTPDQLRDREINLRFGTYYMKSVLDDLDGSQALASAAYNAGPGRARTWRAALVAPVETAIFAELIPFTETRDYVKKVLSNATIYAALMSGKPQSLKARLGSVAPKAFTPTELP